MVKADSIKSLINREFIDQIPGLFVAVDSESKFLTTNRIALSWTGFKTFDAMIGESYCNMPCRAAEQCEAFTQQDLITIKRNNHLRILGYYCYSNNEWKILFGEKYPLRDKNNKIIAVIQHFNDITGCNIIDLTKFLNITTNGHSIDIHRRQISYIIEDNYATIPLTEKQSECMFFLLRGRTTKEIAKILNLSPRTVESHLEQIKFRLNCFTKSELIEKAIANGYMNLLPKSLLKLLK